MRTAMLGVAALVAASTLLSACGSPGAQDAISTPPARHGTASVVAAPPLRTSSARSTPSARTTPSTPTVLAKPRAKPVNHCAHNTANQLVLVKLDVQHMWLCARTRTVYSNAITSGMAGPYTETPTGRYHIQGLDRNSVLTLNTGAQYDVKYWIPFDAPLFGFHDSSWQDFPYGSPRYASAGSHGCIHMPLTAIAFLYRWADIGADVAIS